MEPTKCFLALIFVIISLAFAKSSLISNAECSQGITYWCEHVTNAKKCNAVDFCIQTVWEKHLVQIDSNPICDDCKEWVEQARDFIARKEPFDKVIRTLEWSCGLCPDEDVQDRCKTFIENNVHEIQKILVSQMDPDAVCSAVHLCNNKEFTEMFKNTQMHKKPNLLPFTCGQCNHIGDLIEKNMESIENDDMLEGLLSICRQMSSFSDSCSSLVLTNFNEIRKQMPKIVNKQKLCHATCSQHHKYNEGIIDIQPPFDDSKLPCELCEQLMLHLRELLITNTTEIEFKNVLEGFCGQMPAIQDECISIVDEYYDSIYKSLADTFDANKTCTLIKVCKPQGMTNQMVAPKIISNDLFPKPNVDESAVEVDFISNDSSLKLIRNGALCTACEYTMQLIHLEMSKHTIQDEILAKAKAACKTLPQYVRQCEDTIDMFGDQIMSAIYQGTNPRLVCPIIKMCPPNFNFHYLQETAVNEKPTCPFCLFAMQEMKEVVSSNSTKESILKVLDGLCTHLSVKLQPQCTEFVKTYSSEVVDMIIADFTPQEACIFIKLCSNSEPKFKKFKLPKSFSESSESVEIADFDDSSEAQPSKLLDNPQCKLCKTLIAMLEQRVININSKEEIRRELENSCARLKKFSKECKSFVDKYSDKIVDLVAQELSPERVCQELIFCVSENDQDMQDYDVGLDIIARSFNVPVEMESEEIEGSTGCIVCEFVMTKIEEELNDKQTDEEVKSTIKNICSKMPSTVAKQCNQFIDYYFDMIIALIETTKPMEMCTVMKLCPKQSDILLEAQLIEIKSDVYTCAVCKGVVDAMDTIIEDPQTDTNLENLEEKICAKFAGKFKDKCHNLASTFGVAIINLLKNVTESDQICFKLDLCPLSSGMVKIL